MKLPVQVEVASVVNGRYPIGLNRPSRWEDRVDGVEVITTSNGDQITLLSSGQQSTPSKGWRLILTGGNAQQGYTWTLYGLPT